MNFERPLDLVAHVSNDAQVADACRSSVKRVLKEDVGNVLLLQAANFSQNGVEIAFEQHELNDEIAAAVALRIVELLHSLKIAQHAVRVRREELASSIHLANKLKHVEHVPLRLPKDPAGLGPVLHHSNPFVDDSTDVRRVVLDADLGFV